MDEGRKRLFFGWLATSALITVVIAWFVSSSMSSIGNAVFIVAILYVIVLFLWFLPFIFLRALWSEVRERFGKHTDET
ncbi:MAG TPA: hypothetical protein VMB46_06840 [Methanomassiliicoccales archaeon]|nr:hypothetical protein [Methanomassiliicoccales archaeon]